MENRGDPCDYCVNYNELCDALNLIERLEETVQSTWDGVREMLEEIASAFAVPTISNEGVLTNGQLVEAVVARAGETPQRTTVAESADALYFALHEIIGEGSRNWSSEVILDDQHHVLNEALDIYEKAKMSE